MRTTTLLLLTLFTVTSTAAQSRDLPRRAFLGAAASAMTPEARAANKLDEGRGLVISQVFPGAAAAEAGLRPGDVVLSINAKPTNAPPDFSAAARALKTGDRVEFAIVRAGAPMTLAATAKDVRETPGDFEVLYRSVEVDGVRRRVVVTKPQGAERHPAVLLVGGIGCYSTDNPFAPDDAYRRILYHLTRNGFVTMRVEKSGMGDSEGPPCATVNLDTEVAGYVAGLRALKGYEFVDPKSVFIFGHSIGGISGPLAAIAEPVRGIAVAATTSINWVEYELDNTRRQLALSGAEPEALETALKLKERCMHELLVEKRSPDAVVAERADCQQFMQYPAHHSYMHQIAEQNLPGLWKRLDVPVLVLDAGADFVTSRREHDYLVATINRYHPGKGTLVRIPDMDHYLDVSPSEQESFAAARQPGAERRFNERINAELLTWLKANL